MSFHQTQSHSLRAETKACIYPHGFVVGSVRVSHMCAHIFSVQTEVLRRANSNPILMDHMCELCGHLVSVAVDISLSFQQ